MVNAAPFDILLRDVSVAHCLRRFGGAPGADLSLCCGAVQRRYSLRQWVVGPGFRSATYDSHFLELFERIEKCQKIYLKTRMVHIDCSKENLIVQLLLLLD